MPRCLVSANRRLQSEFHSKAQPSWPRISPHRSSPLSSPLERVGGGFSVNHPPSCCNEQISFICEPKGGGGHVFEEKHPYFFFFFSSSLPPFLIPLQPASLCQDAKQKQKSTNAVWKEARCYKCTRSPTEFKSGSLSWVVPRCSGGRADMNKREDEEEEED